MYLHYVLDLWADWWRKRFARGDVIIVRFADDFIVGFEEREDAERFLAELRERFAKFGLELHPDKTRLIEFGRHAARRRAARGEGKPETFDFLGFTHICATSRSGRFWIRRITISKRMRAKLTEVKTSSGGAGTSPSPSRDDGWPRGARASGLLRRARQHRCGERLPDPGRPALASGATAPQPEAAAAPGPG